MRRDTSYLFLFSPNAGKYGPETTPYLDTFHAVTQLENINIYLILYHFTLWLSLVFTAIFNGALFTVGITAEIL